MTPVPADTATDLLAYAVQELHSNASLQETPCKVCGGSARLLGAVDFLKTCNDVPATAGPKSVPVYYWRCTRCDFVFTRFFDRFTPAQWGEHLYNADYYATIDPQYATVRPQGNAQQVDSLLGGPRSDLLCLDYGGGNGKTAELLRAKGYAYDTYDPYGHTATSPERLQRYNFCSSFEVAEHSPDPAGFMGDIVRLCSPERLAVLVSTFAHDGHIDHSGGIRWWYAAPRNGHISLYSRRALQELAQRFELQCTSFSARTHLFTRGYTPGQAKRMLARGNLVTRARRLLGR